LIAEFEGISEIKDSNGIIFKFSSHQFRHTIGTQMINNGVPQVIVQQYCELAAELR
jgi:integrase